MIESSEELVQVLAEYFLLHLPSGTRIDCPGWTGLVESAAVRNAMSVL